MTLLDLGVPTRPARPAIAGPAPVAASPQAATGRRIGLPAALGVLTLVLMGASLLVGAGDLSMNMLVISRIPRTLAVVLAGAAMAVGGLLMQLLVRNRFVEPATVGTTESAGAGLLAATLIAPSMPVVGKMGVAVVAALLGTWLFLRILRAIPPQSALVVVPLVGLMLSGVISSATTFVAYRLDLLQTLTMWMTGDFSGVLRGRFELLWLVAIMLVVTWLWADRFTVAGLGRDHATNLGLSYRQVMAVGLTLVAVSSAVCVVVVGGLPFLGLVVPNLVSLLLGDRLRASLPVVAFGGASFVLVCDILARTLNHPYELPVGILVGVIGAAIFLALILRRRGPR